MRIIFTVVCFCFSSIFLNGQSAEHLKFKGVPIDGTLDQFVLKMKAAGLQHMKSEDGIAYLKGEFAGYQNCHIGVASLLPKDITHKVIIIFPENSNWDGLHSNYIMIKKLLIEKYGNPTLNEEKFDSYSEPSDDRMRFIYVQMEKCQYYSIWNTENGNIQLSIENGENICFVNLVYFDKINSALRESKAKDDL